MEENDGIGTNWMKRRTIIDLEQVNANFFKARRHEEKDKINGSYIIIRLQGHVYGNRFRRKELREDKKPRKTENLFF